MKIGLLTDAPKHNLALMKLSAYHKSVGDEVSFNLPIFPTDYTYASILFERNRKLFMADEYGGPAIGGQLPSEIERLKPDYDLMKTDYSLGYTFRPCWNDCDFCKVPKMDHPDVEHHSIWEFHDSRFNKICLLNNNTFLDSQWRETFEEIWDADLTVIDENGYDLRLLDDEKAAALKRTKFQGKIHFAWDRMSDEVLILRGLEIVKKHKIWDCRVYVLTGYNTSEQDDFYRCQKIIDANIDPYIMPYKSNKRTRRFKRFIDSFMWRKYPTIIEAWGNYKA
jgi:hypothetical protein